MDIVSVSRYMVVVGEPVAVVPPGSPFPFLVHTIFPVTNYNYITMNVTLYEPINTMN